MTFVNGTLLVHVLAAALPGAATVPAAITAAMSRFTALSLLPRGRLCIRSIVARQWPIAYRQFTHNNGGRTRIEGRDMRRTLMTLGAAAAALALAVAGALAHGDDGDGILKDERHF